MRIYVRDPGELRTLMGAATMDEAVTMWLMLSDMALLDAGSGLLSDIDCARWGRLVSTAKATHETQTLFGMDE